MPGPCLRQSVCHFAFLPSICSGQSSRSSGRSKERDFSTINYVCTHAKKIFRFFRVRRHSQLNSSACSSCWNRLLARICLRVCVCICVANAECRPLASLQASTTVCLVVNLPWIHNVIFRGKLSNKSKKNVQLPWFNGLNNLLRNEPPPPVRPTTC